MQSIWQQAMPPPHFDTLQGDQSTDVLIVGAGIAGILCAHTLKSAGVDCAVLEAKQICAGITQDTTAKITWAHGLLYHKLIRRFGIEKARLYLQAQMQAADRYARLCRDIACDYRPADAYVYARQDGTAIRQELQALQQLGASASFSQAKELPFAVAGAVRARGQAQLHPLKFLYAIARRLPIYQNTKVIQWMPHKLVTDQGTIRYQKVIVATHFPVLNKHGAYSLKMYQHRSYVLAVRGAEPMEGMYVDAADTGLSFRRYREVLLIGGGAHRTGKKGGGWNELEDFVHTHYPKAEIVGKWATQDCITLDGIPYIGAYAKGLPDVFVATGFNKWGMTNAMVAADLLCDLVREKPNPYAEIFFPSRSIWHPQLAVNLFESVLGLVTPTAPRCPHLGCALKYNRAEHSWDCPCHGSRFSEKGELINNPATDDHPSVGR